MLYVLNFAVLGISFCSCRADSTGTGSTSTKSLASQTGYHVDISKTEAGGSCTATLIMYGNGIQKSIDYPCNKEPKSIINLQKILLVDDIYYSDTESVLITFTSSGCSKENFKIENDKTTSSVTPLADTECKQIQTKIDILKDQQKMFAEWYSNMKQQTQSELEQLQKDLTSLSQLLLQGLFQQSTLPFNSMDPPSALKPTSTDEVPLSKPLPQFFMSSLALSTDKKSVDKSGQS